MFQDYNMDDVVLPIDLERKLPENDIAKTVNQLIESIPDEAFKPFLRKTGKPAYHPRMMMKVILCAYTQSVFSGRKIEANANKFTFVWRKSVEKYSSQLTEKSNQMYDELLEQEIIPSIEREDAEALSDEELVYVAEKLDEHVQAYDQQIEASEDVAERKTLRSKRKAPKQYRKRWMDFIARKKKYQHDMEIFQERNSYSKTDYDATFMRMKDDYMRNGQLKPGYNVQLATEGQYALAYDIFPNPTDTRTLIPFLNTIEEGFFELPTYLIADAGYGSEQNYDDVIQNRKRIPLMTYNQYRKEQKKKTKRDPLQVANWPYDPEEDAYTCPNDQKLRFSHESHRHDKYGFSRSYRIYECDNCSSCPFRSECTKAKEGNHRRIAINEHWNRQKAYTQQLLSEEKTGALYRKRKIDVEPVFGFLKANLGFTPFSVRRTEKVKNEMGFAFMAVNMRKYTAARAAISLFYNDRRIKKISLTFFK
ncbi:IS1182 family transposase [Alkalihalobacillus sp. FSL R5-0424]